MTTSKFFMCIGVFLGVMATSLIFPEDKPQVNTLPAVYVPDMGCNSCHDIGGYK